LSQRWQHTEALQHQIGALEHRVKPLLDDGFPMLQQFKDSMEELDGDVKNVRLASEKALAELTERMAELGRNVCSIIVDTPNELPSTNGFVSPQQCTEVPSGSSCSVGDAEARSFAGCLSKRQSLSTGRESVSVGGAATPNVAGEIVRDGVGQDDHCGGNTSHACSSTEAVSFSATSTTSVTSSCSPRTAREEPSVRGRVRRLVRQFTDGGGAAAHGSGAFGALSVHTKPPVESLDGSSRTVSS